MITFAQMIDQLDHNVTGAFVNGVLIETAPGNDMDIEAGLAEAVMATQLKLRMTDRVVGGHGRVALVFRGPFA